MLKYIKSLFNRKKPTGNPDEFKPVLALIEHQNDLGVSKWYEIVYFSNKWCSFSGSRTFNDGERVLKWKYAENCI